MSNRKYLVKFFTVADFYEEEIWLREQHKSGWRFLKFTIPCFYEFEQCEPEDVIYRLDFKNRDETRDYIQMAGDFGWEYIGKCIGWIYFCKPAMQAENENDGELISDNASRLDRVEKIIKTRFLPLVILFFCCVLPNLARALEGRFGSFFACFWGFMFIIYLYLLVHCGVKLRKMRRELE